MGFIKDALAKASKHIKAVHQSEGLNELGLWLDWIRCYAMYGATPSDWYNYELYKYRHNQRKQYITRRKNLELDSLFNPREYKEIFDNKKLFNETYASFVNRRWIYSDGKDIEKSLSGFNGIVVVKPLGLSSGRGIFTINLDTTPIDEIKSLLKDKEYLVEEKVILSEEVKSLNPPSCNTIRAYTVIRKDGTVELFDAVIRVGGGNSIQDNFHAKGVVYPIDIATGRIKGAGKDLENNEYLTHPSSGIFMPGYQIPSWDKVMEFAKAAALHNPKARLIGWDIAITDNGCEMIEGNYYVYCGLLQIFDKSGKYEALKRRL